ncbi:MAG: PEP-CTERM sorting domain-containing protein [Aquincola tertiaricarbonis]
MKMQRVVSAVALVIGATGVSANPVFGYGPAGERLNEVVVTSGLPFSYIDSLGCNEASCRFFAEASPGAGSSLEALMSAGLDFSIRPLVGSLQSVTFYTASWATGGFRDLVTVRQGSQKFTVTAFDLITGERIGQAIEIANGLGISGTNLSVVAPNGARLVAQYEFDGGAYFDANCGNCTPTPGFIYRYINALDIVQSSPVPEPSSYLLMALGVCAVAAARKRTQSAQTFAA